MNGIISSSQSNHSERQNTHALSAFGGYRVAFQCVACIGVSVIATGVKALT